MRNVIYLNLQVLALKAFVYTYAVQILYSFIIFAEVLCNQTDYKTYIISKKDITGINCLVLVYFQLLFWCMLLM